MYKCVFVESSEEEGENDFCFLCDNGKSFRREGGNFQIAGEPRTEKRQSENIVSLFLFICISFLKHRLLLIMSVASSNFPKTHY